MTLDGGEIQSDEQPDDALVSLLQVANQQLDADADAAAAGRQRRSRSTPTATPRPAWPSS